MKIQDMLSTGVGVLLVSKVESVGGQRRIELLEEEETERTTPIEAFDYGFLTQENADTFPILICRDCRYERHVVNGKVPQHTPFHFLWISSKILVFAEPF